MKGGTRSRLAIPARHADRPSAARDLRESWDWCDIIRAMLAKPDAIPLPPLAETRFNGDLTLELEAHINLRTTHPLMMKLEPRQ
jgi:hypothetical protein